MKLKNGLELIIEKATRDDAQAVIDYFNIIGGESDNLPFGAEGTSVTLQEEIEYIETDNGSKTSVFMLGKINGEIVCSASLTSPSRMRFRHVTSLGIAIKKAYWAMGIGTVLMQMLIDFAKENGITEVIKLDVNADNKYAIHLYEKFGFKQYGYFEKEVKIGETYQDTVLMNLYL